MDMQDVCAAMLEEIDGALGCIVIDIQTGLTVAAEYRAGSVVDTAAVNLVSVVSTDMFRGKMIGQFESVLARNGNGLSGFVREVQMTSATTNQFMAAIPGWDDGVFVLVADKSVSLGLGWMSVHRMLARLESAKTAWSPSEPARQSSAGPDAMPADGATTRRVEPSVHGGSTLDGGSVHAVADGHGSTRRTTATEPDEPKARVALGPRMNLMARKSRGARKK